MHTPMQKLSKDHPIGWQREKMQGSSKTCRAAENECFQIAVREYKCDK